MTLSKQRQGEFFILTGGAIWGMFPIITQLSYAAMNPLASLGWGMLFAAVFFGLIISAKKQWTEFLKLPAFREVMLGTFFLGVLYYIFFYFGLKFTSAGNAALVALMEVFFSYVFFNFWKKEPFSAQHSLGAVLMVAGAAIILLPKSRAIMAGDWLVLLAAMCAPLGNYFQQRARQKVSTEYLLFIRALVSALVAFLAAKFLYPADHLIPVRTLWPVLLISGFIMLGITKIFWVEAIHRIPVTKAAALSGIDPIFTLIYAFIILGQRPTYWQLAAFAPSLAGLLLITYQKSFFQNSKTSK